MSEHNSKRGNHSGDHDTRPGLEEESKYGSIAQAATPSITYGHHVAQTHTHAIQPQRPSYAARPAVQDNDQVPRDAGSQGPARIVDLHYRARTIQLTSEGPYNGLAGDVLRITFKSRFDLSDSKFRIHLMFGTYTRVLTSLTRQNLEDINYHYHLTVNIPEIQANSQAMPLMIDFEDENSVLIEQKHAGFFFYGANDYGSYVPESRKRKHIHDSSSPSISNRAAKRPSSQPLQPLKDKNSSPVHPAHSMQLQMGSPYGTPLFAIPTLERTIAPRSPYAEPLSARSANYDYASSPTMTAQSVHYGSHSAGIAYGSYPPATSLISPRIRTRAITTSPLARAISASSTPTWVRTSELRQQQSSPRLNAAAGLTTTFNPYSQYPDTKAKLDIVGDLDSMCYNWTSQEKLVKRRLVEFGRSQSESTITAVFKPVTPEERSTTSPCVSCIWWARKRTHYVTSVDTIALLEGLVAVHFTVEEKNRIRRNLEGFKPYTVSKNKDESDDIFRLIMGFGTPKPRNIEKDIKVFPWPILKVALTKIIGKYSASYASTSSLIGQASNSSAHGPNFIEIADPRKTPTSTSDSYNTASGPGSRSVTISALTASLVPTSSSADNTNLANVHDLRSSSSLPHLYGHTSGNYWAVGTAHANYPTYPPSFPHSAPHTSWDFDQYYNQPAGMAPIGAGMQPPRYQHRRSDQRNASFSHPGDPSFLPRYEERPPSGS